MLTAEAANQDCIKEEKIKGKNLSIFELQSIRCENINIFNFTVHSHSISTILKASELANPTVEVFILK